MIYFQSLTQADLALLLKPLSRPTSRSRMAEMTEEEIDQQTEKRARYRARQLFQWVYQRHVTEWDLMTDLSKELRAWLRENPLEARFHVKIEDAAIRAAVRTAPEYDPFGHRPRAPFKVLQDAAILAHRQSGGKAATVTDRIVGEQVARALGLRLNPADRDQFRRGWMICERRSGRRSSIRSASPTRWSIFGAISTRAPEKTIA